MTSLSNVLREIERVLSLQVFADWQKEPLAFILKGCYDALIALGKVVDKNYHLNLSDIHGFRDKSRSVWRRLTWEQDDIEKLRSRIAMNIGFLNAFNENLIRYLFEPLKQILLAS
jgi:hypothetical protein